jgi:hypothetical protein
MKESLAKRLLRECIEIATQTLYSEQFDIDSIVTRLSRGQTGIPLLRAYVTIQTAARLTEPLTDTDIDHVFHALHRCEVHSESVLFLDLLEVHMALADFFWSTRHLAILRGKVAYQNDEYSYEGMLYNLQHSNKGPASSEQRAQFEPHCKEIAVLNQQIEQAELKAWKEQDIEEYQRYKDELEARALQSEINAIEDDTISLEGAEVISMLDAKLIALLQKAEESA